MGEWASVCALVKGAGAFVHTDIRRRGAVVAQRASAVGLAPVSESTCKLCSAVARLCATTLRRSSSAASIFRSIHSSNAGLMSSRTRCSIDASSEPLVRFILAVAAEDRQ